MCLMCIEIAKGRMTPTEARKALPELVHTGQTEEERDHYKELQKSDDDELIRKAKTYAQQFPNPRS